MSSTAIIVIIVAYFALLVAIAYLTSGKGSNDEFFLGERKSPWYLVSFGMIGASLSGVTFLSIPGWVGSATNQFSYMQAVLGYFVGYIIVALVLLPLYYRLNLTSIYEYLQNRYGFWSYKTGAGFFLISRIIGASVRMLLVADVLQYILFDDLGVPFEVTVVISIALIWLYTHRGGIKTIVYTDTFQTTFMLASLILTVWFIADSLDLSEKDGLINTVVDSGYSKIFFFDDINSSNHFLKHFLGGVFITIGMTGLDQDLMQKNLTCKNVGDAKKNMLTLAVVLVLVNLIFLVLGALLYLYADAFGVAFEKGDLLFSSVAMSESAGPLIAVTFLLGLIAAAYASADSALTSLTTSFSVDFLNVLKKKDRAPKIRKRVHIGMTGVLILVIIILKNLTNESAIELVMKLAGFTYGPLIGMFFFGISSKRKLSDFAVPVTSVLSILLTFFAWYYSAGAPGVGGADTGIFGKYVFGFELIILNAFITFILLLIWSLIAPKNEDPATRQQQA